MNRLLIFHLLTPLLIPLSALRANDVKTSLQSHCYDCHDADAREGGFQVDELPTETLTEDSAKA